MYFPCHTNTLKVRVAVEAEEEWKWKSLSFADKPIRSSFIHFAPNCIAIAVITHGARARPNFLDQGHISG